MAQERVKERGKRRERSQRPASRKEFSGVEAGGGWEIGHEGGFPPSSGPSSKRQKGGHSQRPDPGPGVEPTIGEQDARKKLGVVNARPEL